MAKVKLLAQDGGITEVDLEVARVSPTIQTLLLDIQGEEEVPLPNISTPVLQKVMEWATHHKDDYPLVEDDNGEIKEEIQMSHWDAQFLDMDMSQLCGMIMGAYYLGIKGLISMSTTKVASLLNGKTTEEMRIILNVQNDFTPEEEEQVRRENEWCNQN